jgi:hypothetical protein
MHVIMCSCLVYVATDKIDNESFEAPRHLKYKEDETMGSEHQTTTKDSHNEIYWNNYGLYGRESTRPSPLECLNISIHFGQFFGRRSFGSAQTLRMLVGVMIVTVVG